MTELDIIAAIKAAGTLAGARLHADELPEKSPLPAVVFAIVSTSPITSLDGDSGKDRIRIQFTCYDKRRTTANQLAGQIREVMKSFKSVPESQLYRNEPEVKLRATVIDFSVWL